MSLTFKQTGTIKVTATWTDAGSLSDVVETAIINPTLAFTDGAASGQANCLWQYQGALLGNDSVTLSLNSLATAVYGGAGTLSVAAVKLLYFFNMGATPLRFGSWAPFASSNSGDPSWIQVEPGGFVLASSPASGWAVSGDTTLSVSNQTSAAASFTIALFGVRT